VFGCDVENDGEEMEVELAAWWVTMLVETGASVAAAAPEGMARVASAAAPVASATIAGTSR